MFGYLVRRVVSGALVLLTTALLVFVLFFYGPNDPGFYACGGGPNCTPERVEEFNDLLGYNNFVLTEFARWMQGLFAGRTFEIAGGIECPAPCTGISYDANRLNITDQFVDKIPVTLSLALGGAAILLPLGVLLGTLAARRRGTTVDRVLVGSSLVMSSIPYFLVILLAILYLVIYGGVLPAPEYTPLLESPVSWAYGLLIPWVVVGVYNSTSYARYSRGSMIESLSEDYTRTARAKGLKERTIVVKHALRAAIVPVVTIFGLDLAGLLAGAVVTERVTGLQGIGAWSLQAIAVGNFPAVQITVMFAAAMVVVMNIIVDVAYSIIDPRVRLT